LRRIKIMADKMEYTKGEWRIDETLGCWIKANGKAICAISASLDMPEYKANAHLIAAAPDMYEALQATDKYFKGCVKAWANGERMMPDNTSAVRVASDDLDGLCDRAAELVARAIARAKG
jgi:hypothetical protein